MIQNGQEQLLIIHLVTVSTVVIQRELGKLPIEIQQQMSEKIV